MCGLTSAFSLLSPSSLTSAPTTESKPPELLAMAFFPVSPLTFQSPLCRAAICRLVSSSYPIKTTCLFPCRTCHNMQMSISFVFLFIYLLLLFPSEGKLHEGRGILSMPLVILEGCRCQ